MAEIKESGGSDMLCSSVGNDVGRALVLGTDLFSFASPTDVVVLECDVSGFRGY